MKIAVIIDTWFPFIGGGQKNAFEISKRFAQDGISVEIITRNSGFDNQKIVNNLKIIKLGKKSKPEDDKARLIFFLKALFYILGRDYNLILAHANLPGLIAKIVMIIKKKPSILVVHGTSIGSGLNHGVKAVLEKFILTKIKYSAQITVSRDFLKIKNVNKNVVYIPNGVDSIFFKSDPSVKRDKNALLFVGRLHPQKNLFCLIEAMKLLSRENSRVKLTIVGDGPQKQEILNLIKKYNLEKSVKLDEPKYGSELVKYFHTSSALILPSIYEGQPLILLEAWASSLPVIVSKTGDNTYLVKDGQNGYFIKDKKSPKDIAEVIKMAFKNKYLDKLGQNGQLFIKNNISWDKSAKKTQQLSKKLLI